MSQVQWLNANERILRRFYEPLVLLSVLDPARGAYRPDLITDQGLDGPTKLWHNFLDQLSWLCDWKPGGDTVTSIAVQQTVEESVFWVASNTRSSLEARDHLAWLFNRLNSLHSTDATPMARVEEEVRIRCIDRSAPRIKAYVTWLLQAIAKAKDLVDMDVSSEDKLLMRELETFEGLATHPAQLCAFAHEFRRHRSMQILSRRHTAHPSRSVWSDIRHYIGRLGSWTKAVRVLVLGAQMFPQRIENARFEVVTSSHFVDRPNADHLTDLRGVIHRMLSATQTDLLQELNEALVEIDSVMNVADRFREDYRNIRPRPHAELLVLEHFHRRRLEFVADDKYIGCSKPSCFSCDLYMQLHPDNFTRRSCHGNLWINWAPPIPLPSGSAERPQAHHSFQMLQRMLGPLRQALQQQILSRRPRGRKLPDSTTGMSSIALMSDLWHEDLNSNLATSTTGLSGRNSITNSVVVDVCRSSQAVPQTDGMNHDGLIATTPAEQRIASDNSAGEDEDEDDGGVLLFGGRSNRG